MEKLILLFEQRESQKMVIQVNKKTIYLIVAVLVIVIVAAAAAVLLMGNQNETTTDPTPTLPPAIPEATSLQFTVTESTGVVYNVAVKDINAATEEIRVDMTVESNTFNYVIKLDGSTSYVSMDNGETWTASNFNNDAVYITLVHEFISNLENWNRTDATYTFTADETEYVISAIHVNPELDDALFATS
ncbi:MAG: hypothetical protein LBQ98_03230 [Nitrososphaerota archaeon]|nr:hypothetical protein [Nitrososphaerota archaeon]